LKYGEDASTLLIEMAIHDFQLFLIGSQVNSATPVKIETKADIVDKLKNISAEFQRLIDDSLKEEELQVFLKTNPFILHPAAQAIPKQKLGDDFVTDFVVVITNEQGPRFVFVELEKSSHKLFTKDLSFTSELSHAIKQTRDWEIWLEKHKAYLRDKLPGLETPEYLIVMGKNIDLNDEAKAHLRAHNRAAKTRVLTYDDLQREFKELINNMSKLSG
jgi:hypothetical protein